MLTARGWWFLATVLVMLFLGILLRLLLLFHGLLLHLVGRPAGTPREFLRLAQLAAGPGSVLILLGLTLALWFAWEWLLHAVRVRTAVPRLRVARAVSDERGPVTTLWAGRVFQVAVELQVSGPGRLPYVAVTERVPFAVEHVDGQTSADGAVSADQPLPLRYRIRCGGAGQARFEGLFVQVADLQGFFYHATFVRDPVLLRVLPRLEGEAGHAGSTKRQNLLPPPGIHRLRRPGSGSELLDLRDYLPGDPPRTIAWKVSARRDRLITKEFESEVPVRCTLFLDTSNSVRVPSLTPPPPGDGGRHPEPAPGKALNRLVDLAASILQANARVRDLTGLCLFDEQGATAVRPGRTGTHLTLMLHLAAEAATRAPATGRVDPDTLIPLGYALAAAVYPDLVDAAVNSMPVWLPWLTAFPAYPRRRRSLWEYLYYHKRKAFVLTGSALFWGLAAFFPASLFSLWYLFSLIGLDRLPALILAIASGMLLPVVVPALVYALTLVVNTQAQRLARWRKQLAALFAVRYGFAPGGLGALLEDDDRFALLLQRFLAEHHVPYSLPLYDDQGRYLFASPEKIPVLARALTEAVGKGHDNELFVLLADLLELDDRLEPLLQAVRVALGRHHQVVVVCPWPPGLPPPAPAQAAAPAPAGRRLSDLLGHASATRFHDAYQRIRRTFARLGVQVVRAAGDEPVPLVLDRLERLRTTGGRR